MKEDCLVRDIINGNQDSFRELYHLYHNLLFKTILGLVHHKQNAEDILQDVFIEAYHSIHRFRGDCKLSSWLCRIAINKSLNFLRNNSKRSNTVEIDHLETELPILSKSSPAQLLEQSENKRIIHLAIDQLPNNQRIAFILSKYDELSYAEIAETMQLTISSVESLIFRARKGLQEKLIKYFKKN